MSWLTAIKIMQALLRLKYHWRWVETKHRLSKCQQKNRIFYPCLWSRTCNRKVLSLVKHSLVNQTYNLLERYSLEHSLNPQLQLNRLWLMYLQKFGLIHLLLHPKQQCLQRSRRFDIAVQESTMNHQRLKLQQMQLLQTLVLFIEQFKQLQLKPELE